MKLLYLVVGNYLSDENSGVAAKILAKVNAMQAVGMDVTLTEFSARPSKTINDHATVVHCDKNKEYASVMEYLKAHDDHFDKILFRYPYAHAELTEITRAFGKKIFFEHNTFENEEALLVQKNHLHSLKGGLSPSYLKYWLETKVLHSTSEKKIAPLVLKHAAGGICVTKELAAYEVQRCPGYKTFVVSNGANSNTELLAGIPPFSNTLKLFMLVGDNASWQGYERILNGLKNFNDPDYSIEVTIVGGKYPTSINLPKNCKIEFVPARKDYFTAYGLQNYHLAFSTLALYKKGMHEAASLKLRDCMMRGFPMILAYTDTDVTTNPAFSPYLLQLPNNDTPLDFSAILQFYSRVRKTADYPSAIQKLARSTFSYEVKASQLKSILEKN